MSSGSVTSYRKRSLNAAVSPASTLTDPSACGMTGTGSGPVLMAARSSPTAGRNDVM
jgi:hypothetical protein